MSSNKKCERIRFNADETGAHAFEEAQHSAPEMANPFDEKANYSTDRLTSPSYSGKHIEELGDLVTGVDFCLSESDGPWALQSTISFFLPTGILSG